jgi:hypothetical protein
MPGDRARCSAGTAVGFKAQLPQPHYSLTHPDDPLPITLHPHQTPRPHPFGQVTALGSTLPLWSGSRRNYNGQSEMRTKWNGISRYSASAFASCPLLTPSFARPLLGTHTPARSLATEFKAQLPCHRPLPSFLCAARSRLHVPPCHNSPKINPLPLLLPCATRSAPHLSPPSRAQRGHDYTYGRNVAVPSPFFDAKLRAMQQARIALNHTPPPSLPPPTRATPTLLLPPIRGLALAPPSPFFDAKLRAMQQVRFIVTLRQQQHQKGDR